MSRSALPGPNEGSLSTSGKGSSAFLGLGGNIGDPEAAMGAALRALDTSGKAEVVAVSSLYRTPPWGKTDQPDFLNAAAEVRTELEPRDLLDLCLEIERSLKRVRRERWGPRLIDIDILIYGDKTCSADDLRIPHPRMTERAFVLVPLAEIAPDLKVEGSTIRALLTQVDPSNIERLPGGQDWWKAQPV